MASQKGEKAEVEAETRATLVLTHDPRLQNEGKVKATLPLVVQNLAATPEVAATLHHEKQTTAPTKAPKAKSMGRARNTNTLDRKDDPAAEAPPLTAAHAEVRIPGSTRRKVTTTMIGGESAPGPTRGFRIDTMTAIILVTVITADEDTAADSDLVMSA